MDLSKTRHHLGGHKGYTLTEMLFTVAMVTILIAMLIPTLGGARRSSFIAVCATNLKQTHAAFESYKQDTKDDWISPSLWMFEMTAYLGTDIESLTCPEATDRIKPDLSGDRWFVAKKNNIWIDMENSIFCRKISRAQFDDITARFGDKDGSWKQYFKPMDGNPSVYVQEGGYIPDGTGEYFLGFEDNGWPDKPGGDQDFNDMFLHFKPLDNLATSIRGRRWTAGKPKFAQGEEKRDVFGLNNPYAWPFGKWTGFISVQEITHTYGLNSDINTGISDNQIMLMDYMKLDIDIDPVDGDDWEDYRNDRGKLDFARHLNDMTNVLYHDGSLRLEDPEVFDPAFSVNRSLFWASKKQAQARKIIVD